MNEREAGKSQEWMELAAKLTRRSEDTTMGSVAAEDKPLSRHRADSLLHMPLNALLYHALFGGGLLQE